MNGPYFLRSQDTSWKRKQPEVEVIEDDVEVNQKKVVNAIQSTTDSILQILEARVSNWHKMIRIIGWVLRFASKEWREKKNGTDERNKGTEQRVLN